MEYIWAPWRIKYILEEKPEGCFLCDNAGEDNDVENYILYRSDSNFVIMNKYPYNPGHLLIAPYRHIGNLEELTEKERNEHFELICRGVKVLKETLKPTGFNMGQHRESGRGWLGRPFSQPYCAPVAW